MVGGGTAHIQTDAPGGQHAAIVTQFQPTGEERVGGKREWMVRERRQGGREERMGGREARMGGKGKREWWREREERTDKRRVKNDKGKEGEGRGGGEGIYVPDVVDGCYYRRLIILIVIIVILLIITIFLLIVVLVFLFPFPGPLADSAPPSVVVRAPCDRATTTNTVSGKITGQGEGQG